MPVRRPLWVGLLCALSIGCGASHPPLQPLPADALDGLGTAGLSWLEPAHRRVEELEGRGAPAAERADAWGELAMLAHAFELYSLARPAYQNAALLAPRDARWPYLEGQMNLVASDPASALAAFGRAARAADAGAHVAVGRVRALHLLGRSGEAVVEVASVLAKAPDDPGGLLVGAQVAADAGQIPLAIERYERLRKAQPAATKINSALALLYRQQGRQAEANAAEANAGEGAVVVEDPLVREVQALKPRSAGELAALGRRSFEAGDLVGAEGLLRKAVLAAPEDPENHLNLVPLQLRRGRFEDAARSVDRALELDPKLARAWFARGVLKAREGRSDEAIAAYRQALLLDPHAAASRQNLGNTLMRAGRFGGAAEEYRAILERDPANAAARVGLAASALAAGRPLDALRELDREFDPRTAAPQVAGALARLLAAAPAAAARDGQRALALARARPDLEASPLLLETLAMALAETGDFSGAVEAQERALRLAVGTGVPDELAIRLRLNLTRYRKRQPCRDPALF